MLVKGATDVYSDLGKPKFGMANYPTYFHVDVITYSNPKLKIFPLIIVSKNQQMISSLKF